MAAPNTSISLGEHFNGFVQRQLRDGRFSSASEVVRAGLRMLEARESELSALRRALDEGEASGDPEQFDIEAFVAEMRTSRPE